MSKINNEPWYLIDSGCQDAYSNMAIDEFLARDAKLDSPVLRFYQWQPYAISLGYNQRPEDIDFEKCRTNGIDVVRRPTGGRAVLHAEEVTYAVIIPQIATKWYQIQIKKLYEIMSGALLKSLFYLGIAATFEEKTSGNVSYAARTKDAIPCFTASAQYEILIGGKKLIGSAQRRFDSGILQHGSVLTGSYHLELPGFLKLADSNEEQRMKNYLRKKTTTISENLNRQVLYPEVVNAFKRGFCEQLQISLINKSLTQEELALIHLNRVKYLAIGR
ncbi:lipoate--protein ligase family protein [candidate division KSB1 bacterium]|nr:lipoate--protein ligase family protein [candidate division KSB1 bacterium]